MDARNFVFDDEEKKPEFIGCGDRFMINDTEWDVCLHNLCKSCEARKAEAMAKIDEIVVPMKSPIDFDKHENHVYSGTCPTCNSEIELKNYSPIEHLVDLLFTFETSKDRNEIRPAMIKIISERFDVEPIGTIDELKTLHKKESLRAIRHYMTVEKLQAAVDRVKAITEEKLQKVHDEGAGFHNADPDGITALKKFISEKLEV